MGASAEEMVNTSIQNLEYEIINAISKISTRKPATIGYIAWSGRVGQTFIWLTSINLFLPPTLRIMCK